MKGAAVDDAEDAARQWSESLANMRDMASTTWQFYDELHKAGFDREQAFALTATMMSELIRGSLS